MHSISGHERNKLFLNRGGSDFSDVSLFSSADSVADSRCVSIWDYDHDGFQDLIMVNGNNPHLEMFRNSQGEIGNKSGFVAVRLVGGNDANQLSSEFSNRDGYGARVEIKIGDNVIVRESRCGEGFSAQNSRTLVIGIGERSKVDSVKVTWPSGIEQSVGLVESGKLLVCYENVVKSSADNGIEITAYEPAKAVERIAEKSAGPFSFEGQIETGQSVRVLFPFATWCPNCKAEIDPIRELVDQIGTENVGFFGVPVDVNDDQAKLGQFEEQANPAYEILAGLPKSDRDKVTYYLDSQLGDRVFPSTLITDGNGNVLDVLVGIPTISRVRSWVGRAAD